MSGAAESGGAAAFARFEARAAQPPVRPRAPLCTADGAHEIGSLESDLGQRLERVGLLVAVPCGTGGGSPSRICDPEHGAAPRGADAWHLPAHAGFSQEQTGGRDAALAAIARWMHANGVGGRWRDELLAVDDAQGATVAAIERAAVRPLGIATHAVHLVGVRADGGVWVQQRALDKATDPGLWDTLMGGLVAAGESHAQTLARETWEEAGLRVADLSGVRGFGRITVRRPVTDGYMIEHIGMFEAIVPDGLVPRNQDGEVERFECLPPSELRARLDGDAFTLEAALVLSRWLATRD